MNFQNYKKCFFPLLANSTNPNELHVSCHVCQSTLEHPKLCQYFNKNAYFYVSTKIFDMVPLTLPMFTTTLVIIWLHKD